MWELYVYVYLLAMVGNLAFIVTTTKYILFLGSLFLEVPQGR